MQHKWEVSDSFRLAMMLSMSGGLMDAYSYLARGGVFANALTGNILLFSVRLTSGDFAAAVHYILPITAFTTGVGLAMVLRYHFANRPRVHWRQIVVLVEAMMFFCVAFLPQSLNALANSLVSLACGAQIESFRKIRNASIGITTTMCISNVRTAINSLFLYWRNGDKRMIENAFYSFSIVVGFVAGAIGGNYLIGIWAEKAILASCAIMLIAFCAMLIHREA